MGRSWQFLAVVGLFGVVGCGPADEPAADAVQGGEGVTVEAGPGPRETGAPADGLLPIAGRVSTSFPQDRAAAARCLDVTMSAADSHRRKPTARAGQ